MVQCTEKEKKAIKELNDLASRWPKSLCLYASGSVEIAIVKLLPNGKMAEGKRGNIDQGYIVGSAAIPNEGGGW